MATVTGINPPRRSGRKQTQAFPGLPSSPPFLYMHHPQAWHVTEGLLVPRLDKFVVAVGVNGTDKSGDETMARAMKERRGWKFIEPDVDGPDTDYCKAIRIAPRGENDGEFEPRQFAHVSRFEQAFVGTAKTREGGRSFAEWAHSLVERGIIDPAPLYIVESLIERAEEQLGRYRDKVTTVPSYQKPIDILEANLEVLRAELAKRIDDAEPVKAAPAVRRRGKKEADDAE